MNKKKIASVTVNHSILEAVQIIENSGLEIASLVDSDGIFLSIIKNEDLQSHLVDGVKAETPLLQFSQHQITLAAAKATPKALLDLMDVHSIDQVPVLDNENRLVNIVNRDDIHAPIPLSTPHLGSEELKYVNEAFSTNWIAPVGPNIDAFEREICNHVGAQAACAVSSGTAGLHLGLRLLEVNPGDTVFVSDFTFIASVAPITYQHATPVLIDSEPESWNMSPAALKRAFASAKVLGKMPKAVIVAGLYGQSPDMNPILEICDIYGVPVLEDAAETLGAKYKEKPTGTLGRIGVYSFNGNKIITTSAGGMLVSNEPDLMISAKKLSTQAREPELHYEHLEVGYNYRMSNILAGVGRGQLRVLEERVLRRREINEQYREGLCNVGGLAFMPEPDWSYSNRWLTCVTLKNTSEKNISARVIHYLQSHLIEARPLWKPMHMQPVFKGVDFHAHHEGREAVSKKLFNAGICLPSGSNMTEVDVEKVIALLKNAIAESVP